MKRLLTASLLAAVAILFFCVRSSPTATDRNQAEIRQLIQHWTKAFEAKNINEVMSIYAPGDEIVAFDIVPPLQYRGRDAYRKDYQAFFDQYQGPLHVEYREVKITAGDTVAFSHGLERISGTLKNGHNSDVWVRFTECYRKIDGRWRAVHDHISVPANFETGKAELSLQP